MVVTLQEIFKFAECTSSSRNFIEGERVLNSKHILTCGKLESAADLNIRAYCLQTSNLRGPPHEINGVIGINGSIINFNCSCKAGQSERCKHVVAVLLYCFRCSELELLSSTDVRCTWKTPQKKALEQYEATTVEQHEYYKKIYKGCDTIDLSAHQITQLQERLLNSSINALTKHM